MSEPTPPSTDFVEVPIVDRQPVIVQLFNRATGLGLVLVKYCGQGFPQWFIVDSPYGHSVVRQVLRPHCVGPAWFLRQPRHSSEIGV